MATEQTTIKPSPEARRLYGRMCARATFHEPTEEIVVPLSQVLALSAHMQREGASDPLAYREVQDLKRTGWISPHPDGGWSLS